MPTLLTLAAAPIIGVALGITAAADATSTPFDYLTPILSTGMVGVILLMILFRIKVMPTYVYEDAKKEWERQRADMQADLANLREGLQDANAIYTQQVIPTLTRVLDAERELVELRRNEQRRHP